MVSHKKESFFFYCKNNPEKKKYMYESVIITILKILEN